MRRLIRILAGGLLLYVSVGVDQFAVQADFIMEVRTCAASAVSEESDFVAPRYMLTFLDHELFIVPIGSLVAMSMVNFYCVTESGAASGKDDDPISGRYYGRVPPCDYVSAFVKPSFAG